MNKTYIWIGVGIFILLSAGVFAWWKMRKSNANKIAPANLSEIAKPKPILFFDDDLGRFIRLQFIDADKKTYPITVFKGANLTNVVFPPYRLDITCSGTKANISIHQNTTLILSAVLDTTTYDIQLL